MTDRFDRPAEWSSGQKTGADPATTREQTERVARDEARRTVLRFWTKVLVFVAAVFLCVFGISRWGMKITELPYFQVTKLEVTGDTDRVPRERVEEVIAPLLAGSYFSLNLEEARRLIEMVPWVKQAVVRRVWPNALSVHVKSYRAMAMYEDGRLVSPDGELFSANPDERENLSVLLPTFLRLFRSGSGDREELPRIYACPGAVGSEYYRFAFFRTGQLESGHDVAGYSAHADRARCRRRSGQRIDQFGQYGGRVS
ncbi:protein containing Polypeptide-transport-associated, FtsQ-type domain protein [gut metagenome]|uniref:Protein containing Polypeptide-transport-associated, FtsQ-type domain protein n=1 Tax=gut metagenome TaxID=749906 RepID=J9GIV8_9ZZZZ